MPQKHIDAAALALKAGKTSSAADFAHLARMERERSQRAINEVVAIVHETSAARYGAMTYGRLESNRSGVPAS
jgi:hypothetical protein